MVTSPPPLHRGGLPSTIAVNAVLAVAEIYFLLPLVWVLIAATKSPGDLFASFGLWFSDSPQAWENLVALFTQDGGAFPRWVGNRSEEHTSELQSLMRISYAVFCLKKKKHNLI